jgi:hypothetical protein
MAELVDRFLATIKEQTPTVKHNEDLLCILEGDLLKFIVQQFKEEFKEADSLHQIEPRIAPINFLKRIIDKLSKIYSETPKRKIVDGTDQDQELLEWYVEQMEFDAVMNLGNEFFNTFKNNLNQVYVVNGQPKVRAIPNDRFYVFSDNKIDPTIPTHIILPMGYRSKYKEQERKTSQVDSYVVWSDTEVYAFDSEGEVYPFLDSGEFTNPFGVMPFMYVNRSRNFLVPPIDTDTKKMSVLLPVLLSDLTYAVKFQSFSIIYGINMDDQNIVMKPNGFWTFKSDPGTDAKPELGQLKPQVDITQVIELITTQLAMWLNSRNIRPGSIGQIAAENMASGISKMVDEMDTSDERKKQVEFYKTGEQHFWQKLMHNIHPAWVKSRLIDETRLFSQGCRVMVEFPQQLPQVRRGDLVRDLRDEVEAGFISRESAIKRLNPDMEEAEFLEELRKINGSFEITTVDEIEESPEDIVDDGELATN